MNGWADSIITGHVMSREHVGQDGEILLSGKNFLDFSGNAKDGKHGLHVGA